MENISFIKKAIQWAENHGFKQIKANCKGYKTPTQFTAKSQGQVVVPDISGMQLGSKSYIEIATKTDKITSRITKWKLLSTLANIKGGKLFLLAPKGHKYFAERIVRKYNLNAQVENLKIK